MIRGKEGKNHNFIHSFNRAKKEWLLFVFFSFFFLKKKLQGTGKGGNVCFKLSHLHNEIYERYRYRDDIEI